MIAWYGYVNLHVCGLAWCFGQAFGYWEFGGCAKI